MTIAPNDHWALQGAPFTKSLHVSPRMGITYVNNPKVACTTIKLTLQRTELGDAAYEPATSVHDREASPLLTWPELTGQEDTVLSQNYVFSFVRNPFERLRSAYLNKIVMPQKKGAFRERAGFSKNTCPDFEDFVLAVCAQSPDRHDPHWRPQSINLSVGRVQFNFIGRLESFATDWAALATKTGLPAEADFAGRRTGKKKKANIEFSPAAAEAVQTAFAADFENFGYSKDMNSG